MKRPLALFCGTFIIVSLIWSIIEIKEAVTLCLSLLVISLVVGTVQFKFLKGCLITAFAVIVATGVFIAGYTLQYKNALSYVGEEHTFYVCVEDVNTVKVSKVDGKRIVPFRMNVYFDREETVGEYLLITGVTDTQERSGLLYDNALYDLSNNVYMEMLSPTVTELKTENTALTVADDMRTAVRKRLGSLLDEDTSGKMAGILLGDKSSMNITQKNKYSAAGISHIFAVSGLHLSALVGMLLILLRLFRLNRKTVAVVLVFAVIFFMWFVGSTPSVQRAGIMTVILCLSYATNKRTDPLTSLCLAGAIICAGGPYAAADCGFLLSFLAVLAIITTSKYFNAFILRCFLIFKSKNKAAKTLSNVIGTSLSVLFFTLPVIVICFGGSTILSPITNVFVLWVVAPILLMTVALLVIPIKPIAFILTMLIKYIDIIVDTLVKFDIFGIVFTQEIMVVLFATAVIFIFLCKIIGRPIVNRAILSFMILTFVTAITTYMVRFDGLTVIQSKTLDGNAVILVEDKKAMAILEGDFDFAPENTVYEICGSLADFGIFELDTVVLNTKDVQFKELLESNIPVRNTYINGEFDEFSFDFVNSTVSISSVKGNMSTHVKNGESSFSVFGQYLTKGVYDTSEADVVLFAERFPDISFLMERSAKVLVGGNINDGNKDKMKIVERFLKNNIYTVDDYGKIEIRTTGNGDYTVKTERDKDVYK